MKTIWLAWLTAMLPSFLAGAQESPASPETIRFRAVELYVDSQDKALAAYQLEFRTAGGQAKIVGIEGGEPPEFKDPPFYDPQAMQQERVILGAFSTAAAEQLPKGNTRVATVHLQTRGPELPHYVVQVTTAATVNGRKISVEASAKEKPRDENSKIPGQN